MNAGPKTACGGKRPSTGVVAQYFCPRFFPSILGLSWFLLSI